ncbi:MAG TPA: zf-HC2 domain-containing protein [Chloroflexota bacterium]|nr:zf-HC2 domain-containing protein [Chloroflexota bacterium]
MAETDDARCHATRELVVGHIVGTLTAAERARFDAHLQGCTDCRAYVAKMDDAAALRCQELVELVTDYLEDRLPPAERERLEAHLALCEGCDAYLEQMRTTIRLAGRLTEESIAPEAKEALLTAFRGWKRG